MRGGTFTYVQQPYGYEFDLDHVKWTEDLQVTGEIRWRTASGNVSADVKLRQDGKDLGDLSFAWNDVDVNAIASVTGTLNGNRVKAKANRTVAKRENPCGPTAAETPTSPPGFAAPASSPWRAPAAGDPHTSGRCLAPEGTAPPPQVTYTLRSRSGGPHRQPGRASFTTSSGTTATA